MQLGDPHAEVMQGSVIGERYVVVALFEPIAVGTLFSRKDWPAHVTLASNFITDVSVDDVVLAVRRVCAQIEPIVLQFDGAALFGRNHDVPVRLVRSAGASTLHRHLADQLQPLPGFAADDPAFWRNGYRPHLTLSSTESVNERDSWSACSVAIARLDDVGAVITAAFNIPEK
ncbi:2'-5' RNA ligase family protein [Cryobacterium sp. Hh38]|uniref:2'-5' RNA ligase family protein n=1 Tax=Cryobacterium sp. Hh38 TaxID=1259156 RepID=UPI00106B4735|nr:2'-5' RNA ligase family protein [Cryobacterium sp. Hh38]TFD64662.1 2'-5' RNA ligase family protein [Cryobacterium sp. Hh38]